MKKEIKFSIIYLLFVISLLTSFVSAQEAPGIGEVPLAQEIQAGQQTYEQYTAAENKSAYLTQQWGDLLGKAAYIGPVVKGINAVFNFLNPFFRIVLGYGYGLSWAFVFALIIWLVIFFFINPIFSQLTNNGLIGAGISFIVASLVGISKGISTVVTFLIGFINNPWIVWIGLLIGIISIFVSEILGRIIKTKIKKMKEKRLEEQRAQSTEIIKMQADVAKEKLKNI